MQDKNIFENTVGLLDLALPDIFYEDKDYIYTGSERYSRTYVISTYPQEMYVTFFNTFYNVGQISISVYIDPSDPRTVIKDLTNKINVLKSNAYLKKGEPNYAMLQQIEDLDLLRREIQRNVEKILYVQVLITIYAQSIEELIEKCEEFETRCSGFSLKPRCLSYEQKEGYITSLPLSSQRYIEHIRSMTTGGVACCIPTGNTEVYYDGGFYMGYNLLTNSPIFYNQFANELNNGHVALFGTTGSGKSTTIKTIAGRMASFGWWLCMLDPEGEYEKITNLLGGKYIKVKAGEKIGINPFELDVEEDDDKRRYVDINSKISEVRFMLGIIADNYIGKKLDGVQLAIIERFIRELYDEREINTNPESLYLDCSVDEQGNIKVGKIKKQMPTLSDLRNKLMQEEETKELAKALEIFAGNNSLALFDCQTTVDVNERIIGFDLKEFDKDRFLKFFASINILNWIWNKYSNPKFKNQKKVVIFDEAWMFSKYDISAEYLESISRRGRKYKTSLMIASQTINEFLSSQAGEAVINMCATKILLRQEPDMAEKTAKYFYLSENAKAFLTTADKGQAILLNSREKVLIQVTPFDFEWNYVTT